MGQYMAVFAGGLFVGAFLCGAFLMICSANGKEPGE